MVLTVGVALLASCAALGGCASVQHPPIHTVPYVDLERFMGDWYVIANIPTFVEKDAYNAVESYRLDADYRGILDLLAREGYDTAQIRRVPQRCCPEVPRKSTTRPSAVH